jgi:hypothetical protein
MDMLKNAWSAAFDYIGKHPGQALVLINCLIIGWWFK